MAAEQRRLCWFLTAAYALIAAALLTNGDFRLFAPEPFGMVFNDMALRLARGDWSIDPAIIQNEGFRTNGHITTYFGILPALLRIPFVLLGGADVFYSRLSCLAAMTIFIHFNLKLALRFAADSPATSQTRWIVRAWCVSMIVTGPAIYVLGSSYVYNEPIFWGVALAAAFTYIALKRCPKGRWPEGRTLVLLAGIAGLALHTRITEGFGLYAATGVLILRGLWHWHRTRDGSVTAALAAAATALAFIALACVVNNGRWGSPLNFSPPLQTQLFVQVDPHHLEVLMKHGAFNPLRLPVALFYYLAGMPFKAALVPFMEEYYAHPEGPRVPMLLAAPLAFILAGRGLRVLVTGSPNKILFPGLLVIAHALTAFVVLCAAWFAVRYSIELWGLISILAALGVRDTLRQPLFRHGRAIICLLIVMGMAVSGLSLLRYKLDSAGLPHETRFEWSRHLQPIFCPGAPLNGTVDQPPYLVSTSCPPVW